ncbi:hypothetical protein N7478_009198 [Penicillium angulare]|uniref:uncharacterized protein n=1 Tax=Penicillium angulare TaxID=116970 RepID=UPI0025403467|nr:uncharacterized protein N7478_009198 [Penicillium angulare]KAJ5274073.1 hypothetical protein N7478_009198 [Penicillium angulare]
MIVDLGRLSEDPVLLDKERTFESNTETRMRDAFLYLRNSCEENCRKLSNRRQRSQNLVELLYNLTAARDGLTSLEIARKNTDIARDTKKDSESMKTIAILTMLYLPASLVCSFFGSNFFAFQTNDNGHQELLSRITKRVQGATKVLLRSHCQTLH